jgi:hypothetical protein
MEFDSKYPKLQSPAIAPDLNVRVHRDNWEVALGLMSPDEIRTAYKLAKCARKIAPAVCDLPENEGKEGFVVVFTNRHDSFNLTFQIGTITDPDELYTPGGKLEKYSIFAREKAQFLKDHSEFISSSQNLTLPIHERRLSPANQVIPGGAIAFGDLIVSVSAFKNANMDAATAIAIATGAGLTTIDGAEKIAMDPRVNCKEFMIHEDVIFVEPILH